MTGETDLKALLASMSPSLSETPFAFATAPSQQDVPPSANIVGTLVADEGITIIAPLEEIACTNLAHCGPWARISLAVHSSLSAVGLTAKIATALAERGISANVVAGYFHDHVFVPWDERDSAMKILRTLGSAPHRSR